MKAIKEKRCLFSVSLHLVIYYLLFFTTNPLSADASSQITDFYYYYSEKIYLNQSSELIAVRFEDNISESERENLIESDPDLKSIVDESLLPGLVLMELKEGLVTDDVAKTRENLNKSILVKYSTPVFQYHSLKLVLMDEFVVRFKPNISEEDIQTLNNENSVGIVRKSPYRHNRYVLRVLNPKEKSALETANVYNNDTRVIYSTPNFLVLGGYQTVYPNDKYFTDQWPLHNIEQDPFVGTFDADIDAPEGWEIRTDAASDMIVAVIDSGIDYNHPDLADNMWIFNSYSIYNEYFP